jgi:hypothetical protein
VEDMAVLGAEVRGQRQLMRRIVRFHEATWRV